MSIDPQPDQPSRDRVGGEPEEDSLHTGDDPAVDACTGVIDALEEILSDLQAVDAGENDVLNALDLAQSALDGMKVIDEAIVAAYYQRQAHHAIVSALLAQRNPGISPDGTPWRNEADPMCWCHFNAGFGDEHSPECLQAKEALASLSSEEQRQVQEAQAVTRGAEKGTT